MSPRIVRRTSRAPGEPKASDEWRTPRACFDALHDEFRFAVDLAATAENRLCDLWFGPGSAYLCDAFEAPWTIALAAIRDRACWINPPYSSDLIKRFLECVVVESALGLTIVALVPYSPDTRWWTFVERAVEIRRIPHRVPYLKADGTTKAGAMFPSCVAIFRPQPGVLPPASPRYVTWTWRQNGGS